MDVIALRKGEVLSFRKKNSTKGVTGEVLLNGFPQEEISFRRCSGYVEQFDVQSPELTVKESIVFSAQLRLGKDSPVYSTPNGLDKHVDRIIKTLELTQEADYLVGSNEAGGLSFEQTKRLSIAVELAASPSVIFLDEVSHDFIMSSSYYYGQINISPYLQLICDSQHPDWTHVPRCL